MNDILNLGLTATVEKVLVSSKVLAEKFEKEHFNVVRDIENLLISEPLKIEGLKYFVPTTFKHNGNEYKEYLLTRDGFSLLVMGFTGKKALVWKVKYIEAFNQMESFIREKNSTEWKETRIKGKLARRNETDIILTKLIPLAELQGSKNSGKLFMVYTKLINDCLAIPANSREKATRRVLDVIFSLENLIEHVIDEEVNKGTYYKDIFQICKGKCKLLIELSYLPQQKLIA